MRRVTKKGGNRIRLATPFTRCGRRRRWGRFHHAFNCMIIISMVLYGTNALSEETPKIRGVQIALGNGNRICMSFGGKIRGIIVNGSVNLPGEAFENITKVGNTKIFRSHSGTLTRIGRVGIHRNWRGNIIKIGDARVLRDKHGSVIAVNGDPNVSSLFAISSP